MTVYTACTSLATVTWPEPMEPGWQMLPSRGACPPGYKRRDLSLSDRLFIGAVVNLPKEQRPWGCLTWLATVFATSRTTIYAIGEGARQGMAALSGGRPVQLPAPAEPSASAPGAPVVTVTPHRLARTVLTLLMPGGVSERSIDDCLQAALDQSRSPGFVSALLHTAGRGNPGSG
jgi:hypothetical protein